MSDQRSDMRIAFDNLKQAILNTREVKALYRFLDWLESRLNQKR